MSTCYQTGYSSCGSCVPNNNNAMMQTGNHPSRSAALASGAHRDEVYGEAAPSHFTPSRPAQYQTPAVGSSQAQHVATPPIAKLEAGGDGATVANAAGPATISASRSGKYIPPGRRRALLLEQQQQQQSQQSASSLNARFSALGHNADQSMAPVYGSDGQSSNTQYNASFSSGPPSSTPFGGASRVSDRWKNLDAGDDYGASRRRDGGGMGPSGNMSGGKKSATGTGWDVRDGRRWRCEPLEDVFKKDKDKATGINFDSYDAIPVELSGRDSENIQAISSFRETRGIHPLLAENITRVSYEKPTPVQKHSIPVVLSGRDLMACAQTGSGKTAAFLFPIITKLLNEGPPPTPPCTQRYRMRSPAYPVALVLSPTRELAVQIFEESRKFAYRTGLRTVVLYGGSEVKNQMIDLENGCDICVATPGRLSDLTKRARIGLKLVKYFVLDEADRMLDMGFSPQIYSIVEDYEMPTSSQGRQTIMFSATFPNPIQKLAGEFLRDYVFLTVGRVGSTNDFITQNLVYANEHSKPKRLLSILEESKGGLMLVFVETKKKADLIEDFLLHSGLPAVSIHGDKSQADREKALRLFRTGKRPVLVATDVAARGLDIHNIEHVINCDLPSRIDDYVHRIGRTGRAGNRGKATSFVNEQNRPLLRDLLGLLEEAQQQVPSWFYEMVKTCTSAHRSFGSGGYGKSGGGMSRGRGTTMAFGSRDIRSDRTFGHSGGGGNGSGFGGISPSRNMGSTSGAGTSTNKYCDMKRPGDGFKHDEEEDGW